MRFMKLHAHNVLSFKVAVLLICLLAVTLSLSLAAAAKTRQETFSSPEDAVMALIDAMRTNDIRELSAILGPDSQPLISSGDEVADKAGRERFIKSFEEMNRIEKRGDDRAVLHIGKDDYPMPIPIVKKGRNWLFDTKAGKEEILSRRIGRNELHTIGVMEAYVDAQREYAKTDWTGSGVYPYAQRLVSTHGKKDGLYWKVKEGEVESPFGPLVAEAAAEGYKKKDSTGKPAPFHGYFFKILKAQGKDASGGAFDYVVNGNMILGFGLVAYPAQYGSSGIMTFIVNQDGIVYQKDLGSNTAKKAAAMEKYNPDKTWKKVE